MMSLRAYSAVAPQTPSVAELARSSSFFAINIFLFLFLFLHTVYEALQFPSTPPPAAFAIWLTNRTYFEAKSLCRVEPFPTVLRRHGYEGVVFRNRAYVYRGWKKESFLLPPRSLFRKSVPA